MKAPSEKHLEDYLWSHPEALGLIGVPPEYGPDSPIYKFWFRQFHVPSGIIDLLGCDFRICAFELKKGKITAQSLTQLMRYMFDVRNMVERQLMEFQSFGDPLRSWSNQYWDNECEFNLTNLVRGVLIGHGYEDENLLIACAGCGVDIFTYDYDGIDYNFEEKSVDYRRISIEYYNSMMELIGGDFGNEFYALYREDIINSYHKEIDKHNVQFDAVQAAENHIANGE